MVKCVDFILYVNMIVVQNLSLEVVVECVNVSIFEECIVKIKNSDVDLVILDGGDVYIVGKLWILVLIIVL